MLPILPLLFSAAAPLAAMFAARRGRKMLTHEHPPDLLGYQHFPVDPYAYREVFDVTTQPGMAAPVPGAPYAPSYEPAAPSAAQVPPTADVMARVSKWIEQNAPDKASALAHSYQTLAVTLGRAPTLSDMCYTLSTQLSAAQMADLTAVVPELSECPPGAPSGDAAIVPPQPGSAAAEALQPSAPAAPPYVPAAEPGMPAPPPVAPSPADQPVPGPSPAMPPAAPLPPPYIPSPSYVPPPTVPTAPAAYVQPPSVPATAASAVVNQALAAQLAPQVEANIKAKKYDYDHNLLKRFQAAAGLPADGVYGGNAAGALHYYLHRTPPKALFAPTMEKPYTPPGGVQSAAVPTTPVAAAVAPAVAPHAPVPASTGFNQALAAQLAPQVEANIKAKKYDYDHNLLKRFQAAAGLPADGVYGGNAAGALHYYLHRTPPKALFAPTMEKPYTPPGGVQTAAVPKVVDVTTVPSMAAPAATATPIATAVHPAPSSYNQALAAQLAPQVEANIAAKKYNYDRSLLKRFQFAAGLKSTDGIYAGESAGALHYYLHRTPPKALFAPTTEKPYTPPTGAAVTPTIPIPGSAPTPRIDQWNQDCAARGGKVVGIPPDPGAGFNVWACQLPDGNLLGADTKQAAQPLVPFITLFPNAALPAVAAAAQPALPGYNQALAAQLAPQVEANIKAKKYDYDRNLLKRFQFAAGLKSTDGIYAGESAGALHYYLHRAPPKALFAPTMEKPYTPPGGVQTAVVPTAPTPVVAAAPIPVTVAQVPVAAPGGTPAGYAPALAAQLAPKVESDIAGRKYDYDRNLLKRFQLAAGLKSTDGIYAGESAGALHYYLHRTPPKALFSPTMEKPYTPPGGATAAPVAAMPVTPMPSPAPVVTAPMTPAQAAAAIRDNLRTSGNFGSRLHPNTTIMPYQKILGLPADGVVGPKTRAATAKYGVILPLAGGASAGALTVEDLMKSRPSLLLALRSLLRPVPETVIAGADAENAASLFLHSSIDPKAVQPIVHLMRKWVVENVTPTQEAAFLKNIGALAASKGIDLSLPLTFSKIEQLITHPSIPCTVLTQVLGKPKIEMFKRAVPTMRARWALFCGNQVTMPDGFPPAVWAEATDDQRRHIIVNWLPGVDVVQVSKPLSSAADTLTPWGYDPNKARSLGREVARNIMARSYDYDRNLLKKFQVSAGLKPDGFYGGRSQGALRYYGIERAPRPLYDPKVEVTYTPPV